MASLLLWIKHLFTETPQTSCAVTLYDPKKDAYWQKLDAETKKSVAEIARVHQEAFPVDVIFPSRVERRPDDESPTATI